MAEDTRKFGGLGHEDEVRGEKRRTESSHDEDRPPNTKKMAIQLNSKKTGSVGKFNMNIGIGKVKAVKMDMTSQKLSSKEEPLLKKPSASVAKLFNDDDEEEQEEMPPEAKMKMKNIGRDTPAAAGPHSFGKGKLGFCNTNRMLERELNQQLDAYKDKKS